VGLGDFVCPAQLNDAGVGRAVASPAIFHLVEEGPIVRCSDGSFVGLQAFHDLAFLVFNRALELSLGGSVRRCDVFPDIAPDLEDSRARRRDGSHAR
jgi:hypothetical protein